MNKIVSMLIFLYFFSICFGKEIQIGCYTVDAGTRNYYIERNYPTALSSLLKEARRCTGIPFGEEAVVISSFSDSRLRQLPMLYVNWDDREDWNALPVSELTALRSYLLDGGFMFIDAGIRASFLGEEEDGGQHHSFGEWQARPEVTEFFARVLPGERFKAVPRSSEVFRGCYVGLPDGRLLPDTVRDYTINEKWPDGTYSAVGIYAPDGSGRMMVLAMPIIAMGWARNSRGGWMNGIRLRVLEGTGGLSESLSRAAVTGKSYAVSREDGGSDMIYCQKNAMPAWVREPGDAWRVFRYYDSRQIDDFAHVFYTRLGINVLLFALHGE